MNRKSLKILLVLILLTILSIMGYRRILYGNQDYGDRYVSFTGVVEYVDDIGEHKVVKPHYVEIEGLIAIKLPSKITCYVNKHTKVYRKLYDNDRRGYTENELVDISEIKVGQKIFVMEGFIKGLAVASEIIILE